jgi:alpha-ketoglutarate-dependent taurine dioxygenase
MTYDHIRVTPLASHVGAEISGVDLAMPPGEPALAEIRLALGEYGVVFFRDQQLSPEQHIAFARCFGGIDVNRFFAAVPGYPMIAEVRKEPEQQRNIGNGWHTDHSYDEAPALGSMLYAREVPKTGGDTLFASMYAAYDESRPLFDYLYRHAVRPEFTCRFQWREGSLAFWDNRSTWHFAVNDYHGERRLLHRITIAGQRLS